jgi:hypothetical protein
MQSISWPSKVLLLLVCILAPFGAGQAEEAVPPGGAPPGTVNIMTLQGQAGNADYTATINKAAAAGKILYLPNTGKPYLVTDALDFTAAGGGLVGDKGTTIAIRHGKTIFRIRAPNITFRNITFDGQGMGKVNKGEAYCVATGFKWQGGGMHYGGPTFLQAGCDNAAMSGLTYDFNESTAFTVQAHNVSITDSLFFNNVGFAITAVAGAENFRFDGNTTHTNGIEFAGIVHGAKNGEIANNTVDGTGDNCISVSGDDVKVTGNTLKHCLGHGVGVYGGGNTISGNKILDAAQIHNPSAKPIQYWNGTSKPIYNCPPYGKGSYDGIKIVDAFGGSGSHNVVTGNDIEDDQKTPTQDGIDVVNGMDTAHVTADNTVEGNTIGRYRTYGLKNETTGQGNKVSGR